MTALHPDGRVGTRAFRCSLCDGLPQWRIERHGDAVVVWACPDHLQIVADDLLGGPRLRASVMRIDGIAEVER